MNMLKRSAAILLALTLCGTAWAGRGGTPPDARAGGQLLTQDLDVCGSLIGATPGLYGMCVSYCKAPELEEAALSAEKLEFIAAKKQTVLERYHETMQDGDPEMPCVKKDACPCWSAQQTSTDFWLSRSRPPLCNIFSNPPEERGNLIAGSSAASDSVSMIAYVNPVQGNSFCVFSDQSDGTRTVQQVSDTDGMVCATQLQATCSLLP